MKFFKNAYEKNIILFYHFFNFKMKAIVQANRRIKKN